jgi:hypothetical protein
MVGDTGIEPVTPTVSKQSPVRRCALGSSDSPGIAGSRSLVRLVDARHARSSCGLSADGRAATAVTRGSDRPCAQTVDLLNAQSGPLRDYACRSVLDVWALGVVWTDRDGKLRVRDVLLRPFPRHAVGSAALRRGRHLGRHPSIVSRCLATAGSCLVWGPARVSPSPTAAPGRVSAAGLAHMGGVWLTGRSHPRQRPAGEGSGPVMVRCRVTRSAPVWSCVPE